MLIIGLCNVIVGNRRNATAYTVFLPSPSPGPMWRLLGEALPTETLVTSVAQQVPVATQLCSGTWPLGISSNLQKVSLVARKKTLNKQNKKIRVFVHLHCWKKNQQGSDLVGSAKLTVKLWVAQEELCYIQREKESSFSSHVLGSLCMKSTM